MIKDKIIAFSGAHGTGKTTAVYETAAQLKKSTHGEVGIILETARRCPFPILSKDSEPTRQGQMWIFCEQVRLELEFARLYDLVVSDRTCIDCIGYSSLMGWHDLVYAQIAFAKHHAPIYKEVHFRGTADNPWCRDDGLRALNPDQRTEYECRLLEIYNAVGITVLRERK